MRPPGVRSWIDMSIAMPSSGWTGPCTAWAIWTSSPVWYWNRSTVCAAWCQSRLSVQLRGSPSAFRFWRRKKYVCTSICWIDSSPAPIRPSLHSCQAFNPRSSPRTPLHRVALRLCRAAVRDADLDLDVLARPPPGDGLPRVQLRRGGEDDGVHVVAGEYLVQVARRVADAVLPRDLLGLLRPAADD